MKSKKLFWIRLLSHAEGVSFILLITLGMPLKYGAGVLWPNQVLGMLHGFLFVAYLLQLPILKYQWGLRSLDLFYLFISSVLPFGTFVSYRKIILPAYSHQSV